MTAEAVTPWRTVAATGHRPQHMTPDERAWVRAELPRVVVKLRDEYGMTVGVSGMAIGTDLWWAAALVDAGVDLWAHIPFPQQPDKWQPADRDEWERLRRKAWKQTTYGGYYDVKTLHARNDGVLRAAKESDGAVVAVHKPSKSDGGTVSAVQKAHSLRLPIVHLNPEARTTSWPAVTATQL